MEIPTHRRPLLRQVEILILKWPTLLQVEIPTHRWPLLQPAGILILRQYKNGHWVQPQTQFSLFLVSKSGDNRTSEVE